VTAFTAAELESLLDRPIRRVLTAADRRAFAGRRVLITGGGGSIGSELARQVAACGPARLTIVDHSELNLFEVERELTARYPDLFVDPVLADVTRRGLMRQAFRAARPHVVYHAAAYKHVTMTERAVCPAALVNVFGTVVAVAAAREVGARFVLISSDKAASPRSVMGATKRAAELAVTREASAAFRPIVVRFGNVLGSSGSVLQIMRARIREGRPLPITNPDATRYFMTAEEAALLVMKADLLGRGGETYWLDMGEPVRIGDLADRVIALEARLGHPASGVEIVGLRPGEKLREELTEQGLKMCPTAHRRVWVARQPRANDLAVARSLRALRRHAVAGNALAALRDIGRLVPEFVPSDAAERDARGQSLHIRPTEGRVAARTA
jgi:FlaA1/EpsC-like NDP-sugar epimerase